MSLSAILGPMKSGKSSELIARAMPYKIANKKIYSAVSASHQRDKGIESRLGMRLNALPIKSITAHKLEDYEIIIIDEIHMFKPVDLLQLATLREDKTIIVSGLDLDYRGKLIPVIQTLYQLKPDEITYKNAVCEKCQALDASFTQIEHNNGKVITHGLPSVVPEDGTYRYLAVCHRCFIAS